MICEIYLYINIRMYMYLFFRENFNLARTDHSGLLIFLPESHFLETYR